MPHSPEKRRQDAARRQQEHASLSTHEKLMTLINRGHGNCKEALKLQAQLNAEKDKFAEKVATKKAKKQKAPHTSNRKKRGK
jgi:hypothetical protein